MAWIELHQSLFTHRKTIRAARRLQIPSLLLVGHLTLLWTWSLDNAPEGKLATPAEDLEAILQWSGPDGALIDALAEAGFLDVLPEGGWEIHDWFAYAGRLMEQRKQNAQRMRTARKAAKGPKERAAHVRDTCGARAPATVPNPTVPNQTVPDQGEEDTPALRTLYDAFRAQRHPDSPSPVGTAEWNKALPWLQRLLEVGATLETVTQATKAALNRWKHAGQVTLKAIAEHWTELLEPEPVPRVDVPSRSAPLTASERRDAEWKERTQRDLARQLATFDDWAAMRKTGTSQSNPPRVLPMPVPLGGRA